MRPNLNFVQNKRASLDPRKGNMKKKNGKRKSELKNEKKLFKVILKAKNEEKINEKKKYAKKGTKVQLLQKIKFWPKKGHFCTPKTRPKETKPAFHLNL